MQVFLDFSSFRGVGEVPANDLETFIRVLKKFRGVDERYVKSTYYYVANDSKPAAEIKMSLDRDLIDKDQYAALQQAEADEAAAIERRHAAQLATDVADLVTKYQEPDSDDLIAAFQTLINHLTEQSRLYYKENETAALKTVDRFEGVCFLAVSSQGNMRYHYVDTLGKWSTSKDPK